MAEREGDYSLPESALFLGLDCSTQSLKATVLDASLVIIATEFVHFDSDLTHYKTKDGVYRDPLINGRIVSPTLMWVEALDMMLQRLSQILDLEKIVSISGSAQQHGSVYWKNGSSKILSSLDPEMRLVDQLGEAFSLEESPIWMDCSTTEQCKKIEEAVGGAWELHHLTGSCAHERYVGPQVRKIYETQPKIYHNTERISLVSSFMASLLIGAYSCIDETDGAGMNLMDIKKRVWSNLALEATAPCLEEKLGKLAPSYAVSGYIASYFVDRFHFNKNCLVIQWSGDNPNSLAGLTLNAGDLAVSLGTSDTTSVTDMLRNLGKFSTSICSKHHLLMVEGWVFTTRSMKFFLLYQVRALIEGQFLSMRAHAERVGMLLPPRRLILTGGASSNTCILNIIAAIFGCDVHTVLRPDSASLGASLRAAHGWLCLEKGHFVPVRLLYEGKLEETSLSSKLCVHAGDPTLSSRYAIMMRKRVEIEDRLVKMFGRV